MHELTLAGDALFTLREDGSFEVESTTGARHASTLDEAALLHILRTRWRGRSGATMSGEALRARHEAWGFEGTESSLRNLIDAGLVTTGGETPTADAKRRAPLFMVFCPRSGSNMLRWLLASHPRLTCPVPTPTVQILVDALNAEWTASALRALRSPSAWSRRIFSRWIEEQLSEAAARAEKRRWIFRHWVTYRHIHHVDELFNRTPRYIFLVRHALDVVDAAVKVYVPAETWQAGPNSHMEDLFSRYGGSKHLAYAHFWREVSERMVEFRSMHPSRVHLVRYEDLVERPGETLTELMDFVGEELPEAMVESTFKAPPRMLPAWEGHELTRTSKIERDRVGLWKEWDPNLLRTVAQPVNDALEAWGYPRVRVDSTRPQSRGR